ncbi:peptidylprolyl isomerase [Bacillus sp. FJAT-22090]|uniref:peptidylprolyl isomerase n=1 Tax=Bacillus sp. FJAT-22090 TaxID=1581038 RepID=UPI00119CB18A|nr:peptidylprolyl isomerase [Bacillus sp. FJAT-22090]
MCIVTAMILSACGKTTTEKPKEDAGTTKEETAVTTDTQKQGEKTMYPQLSSEVASNEALVVMHTSMGDVKIKLFPEYAPKTVENFLTHAENGYYDGVIFHRIIEDFMIQGGDPTGTGMGGESIYGEEFEDEFSMNLFNLRGALSMANAGPNTNGSQFFIVQTSQLRATAEKLKAGGWPEEIADAYAKLGGTPDLDHKHTVFGQVIEGMDVVDQMAAVETGAQDKPVKDITIDSIEVIQK